MSCMSEDCSCKGFPFPELGLCLWQYSVVCAKLNIVVQSHSCTAVLDNTNVKHPNYVLPNFFLHAQYLKS